ncbi:MAG: hypothetical protein FWF16_08620, partial [Microbacteriaceae bacterium]|nr:hypothetical protein [Microbacteriaceae bacterium]
MSDLDAGRLVEALGVYERIALAGLRNPAHLDWLTLLPSSQVRAHLVTLVDAGLIGSGAEVELSPLTAVAADLPVDAATRERIAELQAYWAAHAPHEAGVLHGSPGFWTQWWLILTAHHRWPVDRAMPRDEPLGAPAAGPLHFDVVMPALPGFYEREWVENIDRGLLGRLAADGWME